MFKGENVEKYIVDRFEDDKVVLETPSIDHIVVSRSELPKGIVEGTVLLKTHQGYEVDTKETEVRKKRIDKKMNRLFNK